MKTLSITLIALFGIGLITYLLGPKPEAPKLDVPMFKLAGDLLTLEKQIQEGEAAEKGIRPDCQARILLKKRKPKSPLCISTGSRLRKKKAILSIGI
jgi:DNA-directed RNA polymerase subunit RPC12/RpoP